MCHVTNTKQHPEWYQSATNLLKGRGYPSMYTIQYNFDKCNSCTNIARLIHVSPAHIMSKRTAPEDCGLGFAWYLWHLQCHTHRPATGTAFVHFCTNAFLRFCNAAVHFQPWAGSVCRWSCSHKLKILQNIVFSGESRGFWLTNSTRYGQFLVQFQLYLCLFPACRKSLAWIWSRSLCLKVPDVHHLLVVSLLCFQTIAFKYRLSSCNLIKSQWWDQCTTLIAKVISSSATKPKILWSRTC